MIEHLFQLTISYSGLRNMFENCITTAHKIASTAKKKRCHTLSLIILREYLLLLLLCILDSHNLQGPNNNNNMTVFIISAK